MKRLLTLVSLASAFTLALAIPRASAGPISFDANLVAPCASCPNPNFYNGSGNPNGGFTVDTESGIEIGLRAKYRQNPAVINSADNVYDVVSGAQTNTTSGSNGASATHFAWSYDESIDLSPDGVSSGLTLASIQNNTFLTITDLTSGTSVTIDPFAIPDDSTWGTGGKLSPDNTAAGIAAGNWGEQNSENCAFAGLCPAGFTMSSGDYLQLTLTVGTGTPTNGAILGSDTIFVSVDGAQPPAVPEPTSMLLLGTGLVGLFVARRRLRDAA